MEKKKKQTCLKWEDYVFAVLIICKPDKSNKE